MNFLVNNIERRVGYDLNGDGYIGGEGFMSKLERRTHIDFNRDNVIGRHPDIYYGYQGAYGSGYSSYPYTNYGYTGYPY
ncbi:unnamed protein product [Adineta steineri]|uniref:EF-hand domain-containing protein n=1 Tax=Adineta steineri TaxID=433720 RepID=A0A815IB24_9BILA|nr:unnamed protein product [Adineta steineri]CAF1600879.1 unnamed protein product [Adineta steineri]